VITHLLDDSAREAGVAVGDIILKVDGEDIVERTNRQARYLSASTQQSLGVRVMNRILNGPEGSTAGLVLRGTGGAYKEVKLVRHASYITAMNHSWRDGPVMKMLPGNIGYADLDRLTLPQVDEMFEKFRSAKAIVLDLRGLPLQGTAISIAARLARADESPAAMINGPLLFQPDLPRNGLTTSNASYFQIESLSASPLPKYKGKTVMLVDERTEAEAEKAALLFEAANRTVVIGSPSAGSNGDPSNFILPGGITVWFSGHDIRHANTGQLQRLGLQPEVLVKPSVQGIRQGHDEILEKALAYLAQ
jgi:C-terminal processing protease CtpA/Prc